MAIMDSYHDFGKIVKPTKKEKKEAEAAARAAGEALIPEDINTTKYIKSFNEYITRLLAAAVGALCAAKGALISGSPASNFYKEFAMAPLTTAYEEFSTDLFFGHYFTDTAGLYVTKGKRVTGDKPAIIVRSEKTRAHPGLLSNDSSIPTESIRSYPGAITVKLHKKDDSTTESKRLLFEFLCNACGTKRIQYFLDAMAISPSDLCALDDAKQPVASGILYNGVGRMYDPGNSSRFAVDENVIRKSANCDLVNGNSAQAAVASVVGGDSEAAARTSRTSRTARGARTALTDNSLLISSGNSPESDNKVADIAKRIDEGTCYFTPQRSYKLSKADGELLLFDELIFGDKCPPNPKETVITAVLGDTKVPLNSLRIVKLKSSQNGIRHYMVASGKVIDYIRRSDRASVTRQQRRLILEELRQNAYDFMLGAFRISYDPMLLDEADPSILLTTKGAPYYALNARDYSLALLDIKRCGDYGLVAAAAAATNEMNPKETVPIVVTIDRMAAVYAAYRGVACLYVLNSGGKHAKLFNFDANSLAATTSRFSDSAKVNTKIPAVPVIKPPSGGAAGIGALTRATSRPVTRSVARAAVAPVAVLPALAPAPARPTESARARTPAAFAASAQKPARPFSSLRAPPGPPGPPGPPALPGPPSEADIARYAKMVFPPFHDFVAALADLARDLPDADDLLSPPNLLTYSFLHNYLVPEK